MVDFAEGLIDWTDEQAVADLFAPYITHGKITQSQVDVVKQASVILLNLGIQIGFQKVTANQPPIDEPT